MNKHNILGIVRDIKARIWENDRNKFLKSIDNKK